MKSSGKWRYAAALLCLGALALAGIVRWQVVRAFNHLDAAKIVTDGTPAGTPNRRALGYAGDDPEAKQLVAGLYEEFGFDAVDVGGLDEAWRLDVDQPTFVVRQTRDELVANLARAERHVISAA